MSLLSLPSVTALLLLGAALEASAAVSLARVGGAAIVALSIVCWLARDEQGRAARGLVSALMFYNLAVAGVLAFASLSDGLHGMLLWPAVAFHVAMGAWSIAILSRSHDRALP